jgi:hypothetical protein
MVENVDDHYHECDYDDLGELILSGFHWLVLNFVWIT